jgi:putative DNA primase/helicase
MTSTSDQEIELRKQLEEIQAAKKAQGSSTLAALLRSINETGNAELFVKMFGEEVRYVKELKSWVVWDEVRWNRDADGRIHRMFKDVVQQIEVSRVEVLMNTADDEIKEVTKSLQPVTRWITSSQQRRVIDNSLVLAASEEGITVPYSHFDCKGQYLGVKNGVVNLKTGELIQGDPKYMMMKACPIPYDPEAACGRWMEFLEQVMQGDLEKVEFLQQIAGSALVGNSKEKMFVLQGAGSNGKSTFVKTINQMVGPTESGGYGVVTNPKVFNTSTGNPEYFIATMKGARSICMSETSHGMTFNDTLIKQIVDSEEGLQARVVKQEAFTFPVVGTVFMTTNAIPKVVATDNGIWRRLCLIKFQRIFDASEKNRQLSRELEKELPGILNWAVQGAIKYFENGEQFVIPASIEADTLEWRREDDKLGTFMRERMTQDGGVTKLTDVLAAYTDWCKERHYHSGGERELKKNLELRGCELDTSAPGGAARLRGWSVVSVMDEIARMRKKREGEIIL